MTQPRLTFERVQARPVLLPLRRPIVSKVGEFAEWPVVLIDLHTREGIVGRSYLEPYLAHAAGAIVPLLEALGSAVAGRPVAPFDTYRQGIASLHLVGREGLTLIAVSGLDMAAWDALAKAAGVPLAVHLGGSVGPVPAYNSNGLWLVPPERLRPEAAALVAEGQFSALKLRLGRATLAEDRAALAAIREAVGPSVRLMCDFNQGLPRAEAMLRCRALDDDGLDWFEEPIAYDDLRGYAQLSRELRTPVQLGENVYGPRRLYEFVVAGAGDCVMPDLMRIGGVSGWMRAAAIAGAAGIPVSTHLYPDIAGHLMRVTETAHWLEWQDWVHPVLREPFPIEQGQLVVPDRPGAGIEWDEAAVARYAAR